MMVREEKRDTIVLLALLTLFWIYRLFILLNNPYDLYLDEAYYYNWAQNPDWGYYSKPPMLGWLIYLTTTIFGASEVGIKIGSMILYPLTTYVIYLIAKELFNFRVAFYSALIFFTIPSVWMSSLIISTDVVLLLFWSLALLFFIKAIRKDMLRYWVFAGVFSGMGLMSKYNFIFFLFSAILVLLFIPKYRKHFKNPSLYLTIMIAFILFLPNLIWNYQHDFVSFAHTSEISQVDRDLFHPNKFFEFFAAQFLVFGPILFFYLWVIIFKKAFLKNENFLLLFLFAIVTLGFIMILSFLSRSFANWAAVTYVSATILVVAYLIEKRKEKLLKLSVVIHTLLALLFFHYHALLDVVGVELTRKIDPYKRVSGWSAISKQIVAYHDRYPKSLLLAPSRTEVAQFDYYTKLKTFIWNPTHRMQNHYDLTRDLNSQIGKDFLFITHDKEVKALQPYFESTKRVGMVNEVLYPDYNRSYNLFYLKRFKGY
jgi:4-amino-4-deoxy-L-arabinose transferase-like glycosyltransferase